MPSSLFRPEKGTAEKYTWQTLQELPVLVITPSYLQNEVHHGVMNYFPMHFAPRLRKAIPHFRRDLLLISHRLLRGVTPQGTARAGLAAGSRAFSASFREEPPWPIPGSVSI